MESNVTYAMLNWPGCQEMLGTNPKIMCVCVCVCVCEPRCKPWSYHISLAVNHYSITSTSLYTMTLSRQPLC